MKTKTILGISLAAFAVVMMIPAFAAGNPLATAASVENHGTWTVTIKTDNPVVTGPGLNYGYAVFGAKGALAIVTHPAAVDSVAQHSNVAAFHTHLVTVEGTSDCTSGLAVKTATINEVGNLSIAGNTITVTNVPQGLTGELTNHVVSFDISLENGRVCVNPTGEINPPV